MKNWLKNRKKCVPSKNVSWHSCKKRQRKSASGNLKRSRKTMPRKKRGLLKSRPGRMRDLNAKLLKKKRNKIRSRKKCNWRMSVLRKSENLRSRHDLHKKPVIRPRERRRSVRRLQDWPRRNRN
jgi:hypothetical protein